MSDPGEVFTPNQPTATRTNGVTSLGHITVETGPPPVASRKSGMFKDILDKADALVAPQWLRVPVENKATDSKATDRALTAVRRVIRERFGKASEGCTLKAAALPDGDLIIQKT